MVERLARLGELEPLEVLSTCAVTADSRERIQRSGTDSEAASGSARGTRAPLPRANRAAFHSLLQKFREPAAHSSLTGTSLPGLAPRARVNRVASAPKRSIQSSGSTALPRDFDIFLPAASRTRPCRATVAERHGVAGSRPDMAYRPNIIIRATQKNRMS